MVILSMTSPHDTGIIGVAIPSAITRDHELHLALHFAEDLRPCAAAGLAKEPGLGIPDRVCPVELPSPVGHIRERDPDRPPQRAGQMCHCGVGGDDQVEVVDHGRAIDEGVGTIIEIMAWPLDGHAGRQIVQLIKAVIFLEADKANTWDLRDAMEQAKGKDRSLCSPWQCHPTFVRLANGCPP